MIDGKVEMTITFKASSLAEVEALAKRIKNHAAWLDIPESEITITHSASHTEVTDNLSL